MASAPALEATSGPVSASSALSALNALIAEPWTQLHPQLTQQVAETIGRLVREWTYDTGVRKGGLIDLWKYQVQLRLSGASIYTAIEPPPGYEAVSDSGFRMAVPAQGTWFVHFVPVFEGKAHVWALEHGAGVDLHETLTVDLRNLRVVSEVRVETAPADPDRPRFKEIAFQLEGQLQLSSRLFELTLPLEHLRPIVEPDGAVRFDFPLKAVRLIQIPGHGDASFSGTLSLRLGATLSLRFEGELSLELEHLGKQPVPFSWTVDTGLRIPLPEELSAALRGILPLDWGENPPADLTPLPPETDFFGPAQALEQGIQAHIPYGAIFDIVRRDSPPMVYDGYVDSAIWTGHYLAAESFRYAASASPESRAAALERVRFVLGGIRKLFEVTGVPGLLARAALPDSSPLQPDPPFPAPPPETAGRYYGPVMLDGEPWHGFGRAEKPPSRDSYIGVMMGLAYAFQLVPEPDVRAAAADMVTAALRYLLSHHWTVVTPQRGSGAPEPIRTHFLHQCNHQLAFLRVGKSVNPEEFGALYDRVAAAAEATWPSVWGSVLDPLNEPYKFNLGHATLGLLLFLEDDPALREGYLRSFRMLRRSVAHHRNAYFDLISALVELPDRRRAVLEGPGGYGRQVTLSEEIRVLLHEWLLRWKSVASPTGMPTMKTPEPQFLEALFPSKVAPYTPVGKQAPAALLSRFALPVHKRAGRRMDFVWQLYPFASGYTGPVSSWPPPGPTDPSQFPIDPGQPEIEAPGVDYLLAVWMASYLDVLPRP